MATYALNLTFPLAPGTAGTGLATGHKVYYAYPGIPYRFFAAVGGAGQPPYKFRVTGPSGMTCDEETGEVTWSNPTTGTHSVTVDVVDAEDSFDSVTYTLTVQTSGFVFLAPAASGGSDSNAGTLAAPWETLSKAHTSGGDSFVYLRAGTYTWGSTTVTNPPTVGADCSSTTTIWSSCYQFQQTTPRPTTWLAYPGETVTIDFESDHSDPTPTVNPCSATGSATDFLSYVTDDGGYAPFWRLAGSRIYLDGLTIANTFNKAIEVQRTNSYGAYVINCRFVGHGHAVPVTGGNKTALFYFTASEDPLRYFDCVINCYWSDLQSGPLISYYTRQMYVAFNRCDQVVGAVEAGPSYKAAPIEFTDYRNYWEAVDHAAGGDMASYAQDPPEATRGEYWFTHFKQTGTAATDTCVEMNQFGDAGAVSAFRCTVEGYPQFLNVGAGDGPFTYENCVVVNANAREAGVMDYADLSGVTAPGQIDFVANGSPAAGENLGVTPATNAIDADGLLQGSYRTSYLGSKGHEIVAADYGDWPTVSTTSSGHPAHLVAVL